MLPGPDRTRDTFPLGTEVFLQKALKAGTSEGGGRRAAGQRVLPDLEAAHLRARRACGQCQEQAAGRGRIGRSHQEAHFGVALLGRLLQAGGLPQVGA